MINLIIFLLLVYIISCFVEYKRQDFLSTKYEELNDGTYWLFVFFPVLNTCLSVDYIYRKYFLNQF